MDQIKRIPTNKWTKKYRVDPVFLKSKLEAKAIKYLKNQNKYFINLLQIDSHLTPYGHKVMAKYLLKYLKKCNLG